MANYFDDEQIKQLCLSQGLHGVDKLTLITSPWDDGVTFEDIKALMNLAVYTAIGSPVGYTFEKWTMANLSQKIPDGESVIKVYTVKEIS